MKNVHAIKRDFLDVLFSEYVRIQAKGYCARCGTFKGFKGLQTSHFWGRARRSVRWDEDNVCALCFGCHQFFGSHPVEHRQFFLDRLGADKFNELTLRANGVNKTDMKAVELYLEAKLREVS